MQYPSLGLCNTMRTWRWRFLRDAKLQPSLACSTQSKSRRRRPAYVNQSPRNWHWTKKLITKIVHPRPLGPRAPSALSGESRHPRPLVHHCPRPAPRLFIFCGCISSRTRSRDPGNYSSTTDTYNYLLLDYTSLISDASANVPREVSRFLLYACDLSFCKISFIFRRSEIIILFPLF